MNRKRECHMIHGCKGLYIDAFQVCWPETMHPQNIFILTHYHSDHYNGLPRDYNYQGPAKIHCTPITASLLRTVHKVNESLLVEHRYEETWTFLCHEPEEADDVEEVSCRIDRKRTRGNVNVEKKPTFITFYDANHCPGAAMVFIQTHDQKYHLHTGDMRYHPRMKEYSWLQKLSPSQKKTTKEEDGNSIQLDVLYLDTTYAHPKHTFITQEESIQQIATRVTQIFQQPQQQDQGHVKKTLVLLSCYSVGKEKVLWESSVQSQQLLYVNPTKYQMLTCCSENLLHSTSTHKTPDHAAIVCDKSNVLNKGEHYTQVYKRCTTNIHESDLHVIPMGLAGELWPYFQPNYRACVDYALHVEKESNSQSHKVYDSIVAFIPTGWADASNWNKKKAVSRQTVRINVDSNMTRSIHVEIVLIPYSEHSSFEELSNFVQFVRPRKVIPTVFSDEQDYVAIEKRFQPFIDTYRAKEFFVRSLTNSSCDSTDCFIVSSLAVSRPQANDQPSSSKVTSQASSIATSFKMMDDSYVLNESSVELSYNNKLLFSQDTDNVQRLVMMGFDATLAVKALESCEGNIERAIDWILQSYSDSSREHLETKKKPKTISSIKKYFSPSSHS